MTRTTTTYNTFGSVLLDWAWSRSSKNYRYFGNGYRKLPYNLREYTSDYYPFGSSLPTRSWSDVSRAYRYGFNGKEKDSETANDNFDFGARIYDGRLGRWLSVDPEYASYPSYSSYNYTINNPIFFIDPDGNGVRVTFDKNVKDDQGRVIVKVTSTIYVYTEVSQINDDMNCHAKFIENSIEKNWNNPVILNPDGSTSPSKGNAEYNNGVDKFVYVFDVNVIVISKEEAIKKSAENKDLSINFMELKTGTNGSAAGGNTGYFPIPNNDPTDEKVIAHEFGHLMGYIQDYNSSIAAQIKNDVNSTSMNGCLENLQHVNQGELGFSVSIMSSAITITCNESVTSNVELKMSSTNVTTADFTHLNFNQGLMGGVGIKNSFETGIQSPDSNQLDTKKDKSKTKVISWVTSSTNKVE